jgi:hypothetical protein
MEIILEKLTPKTKNAQTHAREKSPYQLDTLLNLANQTSTEAYI